MSDNVDVYSQGQADTGIGYARHSCVLIAERLGYHSFIMADDDVHPRPGDDVRELLRFTSQGRSMGVAGWMSNYGLWVPDGNAVGRQPGLVVPFTGGPDRIFSLNVKLTLKAGNFDKRLDVRYENSEINRAGISTGYIWYVCTSVHIKMINRPYDEGGIVALAGSADKRRAREKRCHAFIYDTWGPEFISHPDKRYACRWKKMYKHYMGQSAVDEVYGHVVRPADEVEPKIA
jgi:hypothetical protein